MRLVILQVISFFEKMENDYGFVRNREFYNLVVTKLCDHGFASYAEKMVKTLAIEFFPDEYICNMYRGEIRRGKEVSRRHV